MWTFTWVYLLLIVPFINSEPVKFDLDGDVGELPRIDSLESEYAQLSNDSLLWGPYRSALYFGLRPRIPYSLLSGLMWFNVDDYNAIGNIRHFYEQGDNMKKANWIHYDPRTGGRQVLEDTDLHVKIYIDFVKSDDGKSWGVKVKAKPLKGYENVKTSFVWYSGLEGEQEGDLRNGFLNLDNKKSVFGYKENVKLSGASEDLGFFDIEFGSGPDSNRHPAFTNLIEAELDPSTTHHFSLAVPDNSVWRARDIFMTMLKESITSLIEKHSDLDDLPPEQTYLIRDLQNFEGNVHYVQKIFEGACEFDVIYTNSLTPVTERITFENIASKIKKTKATFDEKFTAHFPLLAPFAGSRKHEVFAKEALSGLLGGLSYFHGDHLVDRETVFDEDSFESYELKGNLEGPHELFTFVPSRPFFPRGFYWDEGFHLLPLLEYDSDLALEVVKSWFNLIDGEGWIAREQILGPELRSRVPEKFQVQSPDIVNPPTLMLVFSFLLENLGVNNELGSIYQPESIYEPGTFDRKDLGLVIVNNPELLLNYTKEIYPELKLHFDWFRRTQKGYVEEFDRGENNEAYRWRGRTLTHCLASGLDDYPRPLPADVAELNVDLLSWVGVMARSMKLIAKLANFHSDFEEYEKIEKDIIENIDSIHWSEDETAYCDVSVDDNDENVHVCHQGYISLFPFLTKLVPADDVSKLTHLVNAISDPDLLWSDFGIRSLSKSDEFYRTEENYWRSPVWININYLILESLQHYKEESKKFADAELLDKIADTYKNLRLNLVNNIVGQWEKTGYVWEQYDDETGDAKGAKNFLGWTSLVILMMKMPESI